MTILLRCGASLEIYGVTPPINANAAAVLSFTVAGGEPPYEIELLDSELVPAEWTFADNGDGTATITTGDAMTEGDFDFTLRVTDATRRPVDTAFSLRVIRQPLHWEGTLPDFVVGTPYAGALTLVGGVPPYSVPFIAGLPDGVTFSLVGDTFSLSGTPTGAGAGPGYSIPTPVSFTGQDSVASAVVFNQTPNLTVTPLTLSGVLPDADELDVYAASLTRAGGVGNITVTAQSGLPSALVATADNPNDEVDVAGTVASGAAAGSPYAPSITITDANGNTDTWNGSMDISAFVPIVITGTFPATIETGYAYSASLPITGGSGVYSSVAVISGAKPPWMTLAIVGTDVVASGTADDTGATYSFTMRVTDNAAQTGDSAAQSVEVVGYEWTPYEIPGALWISSTRSPTTVGSLGAGRLGTWSDLIQRSADCRPSVASREPHFSTFNGLQSIEMNRVGFTTRTRGNLYTEPFRNVTKGTVWACLERGPANGATQAAFHFQKGGSTGARLGVNVNSASAGALILVGRRLDADAQGTYANFTPTEDAFTLVGLIDWGAAAGYLWTHGTLRDSNTGVLTAGSTSNTAPAEGFSIGCNHNVGASPAEELEMMDLGAVNGELTTAVRDRLFGFLAWEYNGNAADFDFVAALDAANPYKLAPPVTPYTRALLHFDGADASTVITDDFGATWTATGNAELDTAQAKFGASSLLLDGVGDYVTSAAVDRFLPRTGDFTLECWVRPTSLAANSGSRCIFDMRPNATNGFYPTVYASGLALRYFTNSADRITTANLIPTTGAFVHIAYCRAGGVGRLFMDGVQQGSNYTDANDYIANRIRIGGRGTDGVENFAGHVDEFRLSLKAHYTADFTPPAAPFT